LLDESAILGHVIKRLEDCRERNLIVLRKFFGRAGIRTMHGLVDHGRSDASTLEE
jgi:hypothetical protein